MKVPIRHLRGMARMTGRCRSFLRRERSFLGHQRLLSLVYYTLLLVFGLAANLAGIAGPLSPFFAWLNTTYLLVTLLLFSGYAFRKLPLAATISMMTLVTQLSTSVEMLYCALSPTSYNLMLIVGNTVLLAVNTIFSLVAYLKYNSYILSALTMGVYAVCMAITGDPALYNFFLIFLLAFAFISLLGHRLVRNAYRLEAENTTLRRDETELFLFLRMNREQVKAYIELAKEDCQHDDTGRLLELMGEESQRNVMANVSAYIRRREAEDCRMEHVFPELTPSERDICRLVLQDKKLGEICFLLKKSETNINSTRAHIRKKLGLQPSDRLDKALKERMKAAKGK